MSDILLGLFKPAVFDFTSKALKEHQSEMTTHDPEDEDQLREFQDKTTRLWATLISERLRPDRNILRSELLDELDTLFREKFDESGKTSENGRLMLGMDEADYLDAMVGYTAEALEMLRAHLNQEDYGPDAASVQDNLYAKARWALNRVDANVQLPLLCKSVIVSLMDSFAIMDEGMKEVGLYTIVRRKSMYFVRRFSMLHALVAHRNECYMYRYRAPEQHALIAHRFRSLYTKLSCRYSYHRTLILSQVCRWIEPLIDYELNFKTHMTTADYTAFILASIRTQKDNFVTPDPVAEGVRSIIVQNCHDI